MPSFLSFLGMKFRPSFLKSKNEWTDLFLLVFALFYNFICNGLTFQIMISRHLGTERGLFCGVVLCAIYLRFPSKWALWKLITSHNARLLEIAKIPLCASGLIRFVLESPPGLIRSHVAVFAWVSPAIETALRYWLIRSFAHCLSPFCRFWSGPCSTCWTCGCTQRSFLYICFAAFVCFCLRLIHDYCYVWWRHHSSPAGEGNHNGALLRRLLCPVQDRIWAGEGGGVRCAEWPRQPVQVWEEERPAGDCEGGQL